MILLACCGLSMEAMGSPLPAGFARDGAEQQPTPAKTARHVPEAKTHQEFNDYNAAYALSGGAQMEKAADDFSAKYPASELKAYLYAKALHEYQSENNTAKMLAIGRKVIQLDPDNTIALVLTANTLADSLSDADADRQQKIAEIRKDAGHALETVDSFTPAGNPAPEQVAAYKKTLQSMAHSALGITNLKTGEDKAAEQELKSAAELNVAQPDPYMLFNLALAQDHQEKYPEALVSINRALEYAGNSDIADTIRGERKRLLIKNGFTGEEAPKQPLAPPSPAAKPPSPQ